MVFSKKVLCLTLFCFAFLFVSCSKNSTTNPTNNNPVITGKVTFTLNGGDYSNQTVTFDQGGISIYLPSQNSTGLTFSGVNSGEGATLTITGQAAGSYSFSSNGTAGMITMAGYKTINIISGTLVISTYGNIGGAVSGTFSGAGLDSQGKTIQITNGSFEARRSS